MRLPLLPAVFLALGMMLSAAAPSEPVSGGPISIDIDQGAVRPLPIAIPAFEGELGSQIAQVVADDLERSGLFAPIPQAQFIERNLSADVRPNFADWKSINAQALINGRVRPGAGGQLEVDFRLWDVFSENQMAGTRFTSTPDNIRRIGHKIADAVYQQLTGEEGYFDTRIVFVAESGPRNARVKRLMIMDQDGFGPSVLNPGADYIALTPRFSTSSQEITFMALSSTEAAIYLFNIETGRRERLGSFPGMVFAPRFSPDGSRVAFSVERDGNSDIYLMTLSNRSSTRLTTDPGIDTSPTFSPNGAQIAFTSDRAGRPQIYVMNANGSGARRISQGGGSYTTPVWSPKGDFIAFTKQVGGQFHIGVMKPDGSDERLLTTSYLDEGPSWAPNGRVLIFFRETPGGDPKLWTVDVTGRILRAAPYTGAGSDPAWSPKLN